MHNRGEFSWAGVDTRRAEYAKGSSVFRQGDECCSVLYVERGAVRLSAVSPDGQEAIIEVLGPGDFFGEACLAGQPRRAATAIAVTPCSVVEVHHGEMARQLRTNGPLLQRFLRYVLSKNIRIERDLLDYCMSETR